jgi:hypothetical protein
LQRRYCLTFANEIRGLPSGISNFGFGNGLARIESNPGDYPAGISSRFPGNSAAEEITDAAVPEIVNDHPLKDQFYLWLGARAAGFSKSGSPVIGPAAATALPKSSLAQ